jgi:integrase
MARRTEGWKLYRDGRRGIFYVRFTHAGRRRCRSTGTGDRSQAQKRAAEIYAMMTTAQSIEAGAGNRRALDQVEVVVVLAAWLRDAEVEGIASARARDDGSRSTWEGYAQSWLSFFKTAAEIADVATLHRYVRHRLDQVTAATVRKECSALQSLLKWMARPDVGYLDAAPDVPRPPKRATGTRAQRRRRVDLDAPTVESIIDHLPERLRNGKPCRAFFRLLWETGLRRSSLERLQAPRDYRRGDEVLRLPPEADKARWGRELPLTPRARVALDAVVPEAGRLFDPRTDYRKALRRAALAAGVPADLARSVSNHDFRHARTTDLLSQEGASLAGVAYLVGHRQVTTTNRYVHPGKRAAAAALGLSGCDTGCGGAAGPSGAHRDLNPENEKTPGTWGVPGATTRSGRLDSNQRPPDPQSGALTRLRYAPRSSGMPDELSS